MKKCKFLRKDLELFKPYEVKPQPYVVKLDANESCFPLEKAVKEQLISYLANDEALRFYPDPNATALCEEIARFWNVSAHNVICGCGSDQLIDYTMKAFLEVGGCVVAPSPSFSMYSISAQINRGRVEKIILGENFSFNRDLFVSRANELKASIIMICSPNNPTGNNLQIDDICYILENVNSLVVVDEAYAEFSDQTMIDLIEKHDNLLILRTFSKAYGLAGVRVGYAIAQEQIIHGLKLVKDPFNLPVLSQLIALETIKQSKQIENHVSYLNIQRDKMTYELNKFDFLKVYPSQANFLLIKSSVPIVESLKEHGILVRVFDSKNNYSGELIRLTIGSEIDNTYVIDALKQIVMTKAEET